MGSGSGVHLIWARQIGQLWERNKGISARRWVDIRSASFFCLVQWIQMCRKVVEALLCAAVDSSNNKSSSSSTSRSLDVPSRYKAQYMYA